MSKHDDFLVEILTEELPPKILLKLAENFSQQIQICLRKNELDFGEVLFYATPRRLAVLVKNLVANTPDQMVERKGPALNVAFDAHGHPSAACIGFAKSCGVAVSDLQKVKTPQGERVSYLQRQLGKSVILLLPEIVEKSAAELPLPKRMRWGQGDIQFIRPVHSVIMLYGSQIIPAVILGCQTGRVTRGHRFHAPDWINIPTASTYASVLETKGHVVVDFAARRKMILEQAKASVTKKLGLHAEVVLSNQALLDEVTGLVEWPTALCGTFDVSFLALPHEVLISSMQDHQRYFPVIDHHHQLLSHFVTISNIESHDANRVTHGNERVLRARLSDAAFFYAEDKKESLEHRLERLKGIIFQAGLGTLHDKAIRLTHLAGHIAEQLTLSKQSAERAGLLAKTDLTTNMVNEFPELQGIMGGYYALCDHEAQDVALAIKEHYMPRFAGDQLPGSPLGQIVSLADKMDTLIGTFGINQLPSGDKDPFGLRRAALGVIRILIENKINLDLKALLAFAATCYSASLENKSVVLQVLIFIQERLRAWYQDQGITPDVFAAVAVLGITNLLDAHERIKAVSAFKKLNEAEILSIANKRVSNILAKYANQIDATTIRSDFFENAAEEILAEQIEEKSSIVGQLCRQGKYDQVLFELTNLRHPIDDFFDQVMVMTDDKQRRENRLLLLMKLRSLFLQVADIALLQP